jgi:hypothetical protein
LPNGVAFSTTRPRARIDSVPFVFLRSPFAGDGVRIALAGGPIAPGDSLMATRPPPTSLRLSRTRRRWMSTSGCAPISCGPRPVRDDLVHFHRGCMDAAGVEDLLVGCDPC